MARQLIRMLLTALLLLLVGCASRGEIETMQRQLSYLEESSSEMQERIGRLDSLYHDALERNVTYQADLKLVLSDLLDRTTIIDGRLTDIEGRVAQVLNRMGGSSSIGFPPATQASDSVTDTTAADQGGPRVDASKMFDNAFADLNRGNYDLAIMQFEEFATRFPDSPLADDAQYWLGECYYGKGEYVKALPEFEKVEQNYPRSDKLVSALFKMARSHQELGNLAKAKELFQRIVSEYPESLEARPAEERLKGL